VGDIWPYGPPRYTSWDQCYTALRALGLDRSLSNILAAVAGSESAYDLAVVNDTPATGDYSVGLWQINYYGSLYAGRVAEFGTPRHVAQSSVSDQARNARTIYDAQGLGAWGSYTNGNYKHFLSDNAPAGPPPQHQAGAPDVQIQPPTEDYSETVRDGARSVHNLGYSWQAAATVLRKLRG
jgi:Lysozyme like domain